MPRFNPLIKDDRLLPGFCYSKRERKEPKKKEPPKEETISCDPEHVLSMEADTRKEWFQMALMQAATGVTKSASLYAVILEPRFASTKELKKMVEANMHFFSAKQQKELKLVLKSAPNEAKGEGSRDAEKGSDRGSAAPREDAAAAGSSDARGRDRSSSSRSSPRERQREAASGAPNKEDRKSSQQESKRKDRDRSEDTRSRSRRSGGGGKSRKHSRRENGEKKDDGRSKRSRADRSNSRGKGTSGRRAESRSPSGRGRRDRSRSREGRRPRDYRESGGAKKDDGADGRGTRRAARKDSRDD